MLTVLRAALVGIEPRERKALSLGLLTIVFGAAYHLAPRLSAAAAASRLGLQAQTDTVAFVNAVLSDSATVRLRTLQVAAAAAVAEKELLSADSPDPDARSLGRLVTAAAASSGVELTGPVSSGDSLSTGVLTLSEARIEGTGTSVTLLRFLLLLERSPGLVDVRNMSIDAESYLSPSSVPERLRFSLTLQAAAKPIAPTSREGAR